MGLISIEARDLAGYGRAILDAPLAAPRTAKLLKPNAGAMDDLLRLPEPDAPPERSLMSWLTVKYRERWSGPWLCR